MLLVILAQIPNAIEIIILETLKILLGSCVVQYCVIGRPKVHYCIAIIAAAVQQDRSNSTEEV